MQDVSLWIWFAGQFIVAAAIWGGIRMDLQAIHIRLARIEKATDDAHQRIDRHLEARVPK